MRKAKGNLSLFVLLCTIVFFELIQLHFLNPWDSGESLTTLTTTTPSKFISLDDLTRSSYTSCDSDDLIYTHNIRGHDEASGLDRRIPKVIHQSGKTRCLTPNIANLTSQWRSLGYTYYFHDDEAVERLFQKDDWSIFPIQLYPLTKLCMPLFTLKADLWRYLMLWEYGGVYTDMDSIPTSFNASSIHDDDDGYFILDRTSILSQWFIAVSPKHPLMYLTILEVLNNILQVPDTGLTLPVIKTGPHALHSAMQRFMANVHVDIQSLTNSKVRQVRPLNATIYVGAGGRSLRVVGDYKYETEIVCRDVWDGRKENALKLEEYRRMGMIHWIIVTRKENREKMKTNRSCRDMFVMEAMKQQAAGDNVDHNSQLV